MSGPPSLPVATASSESMASSAHVATRRAAALAWLVDAIDVTVTSESESPQRAHLWWRMLSESLHIRRLGRTTPSPYLEKMRHQHHDSGVGCRHTVGGGVPFDSDLDCHDSMDFSKSHFKVLSPTLQGTPPGVPPQGGTLKVPPPPPTLPAKVQGGVVGWDPTFRPRVQGGVAG